MDRLNIIDMLAEETITFHYISGGITPLELPHTSGWRRINGLVVVQSVNSILNIHFEGEDILVTKKDGAIFIPPDAYHKIDVVCGRQIVSKWSVVSYTLFGMIDITSLLEVPVIVDMALSAEIGEINEELAKLNEQSSFSLHRYARKMELGFRLLTIITKISPLKANAAAFLKQIQHLLPVLKHIDTNLNSHIDREDLVKLSCLSQSRFNLVFKQVLGMTPMEYLRKMRMKKAQLLLSSSDLPVSQIAERIGYRDQFHFSHDFKKDCCSSPIQFRKTANKLF